MWFLKNPARFYKERKEITELASNVDWLPLAEWKLDNDTKLCFVADIEVYGHRYPVIMLYPANYPASPPTVRPGEANRYESTHQYLSGELCLEWGPDTWHDGITGADVLISAHRLLEIENPMEEGSPQIPAPSRHSLTLGQELRFNNLRFIADAPLISYTQSLPEKISGTIQFRVMLSRESLVAFIANFSPLNGEQWYHPILPPELEKTTSQIKGYFFKTTLEAEVLKGQPLNLLFDLLESQKFDVSQLKSAPTSLALIIDTKEGLHLFLTSNEKEWSRFARVDINKKEENSRLLPEFINLSTKTVGIVGLGSAGSKVAISLARTGIRNFFLVDHDVFLQENICRHELNWEDVGQHKVDGIAHQLKLIAQDINVKCSHLKLSGQEATAVVDSVLSRLGACNLIIDATADPRTFNQLSTVAYLEQTPMIWLEIYEGGIGGMMARFRPNLDPDPKTVRAHLKAYFAKHGAPQTKAIADYTAVDGEGRVIAASDVDVTIIASNATKLALDILIERAPSEFPYSLYLIGLTGEWIFKEPFYTIPIDLTNAQSIITESEISEDESNENLDFIEQLILNKKNENSSTD